MIDEVLKQIFDLDHPKINENRREIVGDFVKTTVNGDTIQAYLVMNADLREKEEGALVYILTNKRLIKVTIGKDAESAASLPLNKIIGIENKQTTSNGKANVEVVFQNNVWGLEYSIKNKKITEFFQKLITAWGNQ